MEMVIHQLENSASKLVSVNEWADCFVPHHGYVHTVSDEIRPAEKFDKTPCSHETVQYFRSVQTEIWAARPLNFRMVKVGPYKRRKIRPMPCERNLREDISNCTIITKLRFFETSSLFLQLRWWGCFLQWNCKRRTTGLMNKCGKVALRWIFWLCAMLIGNVYYYTSCERKCVTAI